MNRKIVIMAVALLVIGIGAIVFLQNGKQQNKDKRVVATPLVTVETLQKKDLQSKVVLIGQTVAKSETAVTAKYSGFVSQINVDYGDKVTKGQVLLQQDTKDMDLSLAQAKDSQDQLDAEVTKVDASFQVEYENALADFKYIATDYARYQKLYQAGAISGNEFDAQEQRYVNAKNVLESVKKQINRKGAPAGVLAKKAELSKAKNNIQSLQVQRNDLFIKAPVNGVVNSKEVDEGEYIQSGQKLFSIIDNSEMYVAYQATELDLGRLQTGMKVQAEITALGQSYPGKIIFIGQGSETAGKTFLIRVHLEKTGDERLKAGLLAKTQLMTPLATSVLVATKEAVQEKNGVYSVFILDANNRVKKRTVTIGFSNDDCYEIRTGVKVGDKIVTSNLSRLEDGMTVQLKTKGA